MVLTIEESVERQLMEMKDVLLFWQTKKDESRDRKLIEKCNKEIFKEKYRINEVTIALIEYRKKHEDN